jgi:hypothetical protein
MIMLGPSWIAPNMPGCGIFSIVSVLPRYCVSSALS